MSDWHIWPKSDDDNIIKITLNLSLAHRSLCAITLISVSPVVFSQGGPLISRPFRYGEETIPCYQLPH